MKEQTLICRLCNKDKNTSEFNRVTYPLVNVMKIRYERTCKKCQAEPKRKTYRPAEMKSFSEGIEYKYSMNYNDRCKIVCDLLFTNIGNVNDRMTLEEIGDKLGVTKTRVRYLLNQIYVQVYESLGAEITSQLELIIHLLEEEKPKTSSCFSFNSEEK